MKICQISHLIFESASQFSFKYCINLQCHTLFKRSSLKCKFFRLLSARVKICQILHVNFEMTSQFLFKFCIILQCHETYFFYTFLAQTLYTFFKRSPLKCNFFRLSSAGVKNCKIPFVNFETTSHFLFKFCIIL